MIRYSDMCERVSVIQWNHNLLHRQQAELYAESTSPKSEKSPEHSSHHHHRHHHQHSPSPPPTPTILENIRGVLDKQNDGDSNRLLIKQINTFSLKRLFQHGQQQRNGGSASQPNVLPKKRMKRKHNRHLVTRSDPYFITRQGAHSETF